MSEPEFSSAETDPSSNQPDPSPTPESGPSFLKRWLSRVLDVVRRIIPSKQTQLSPQEEKALSAFIAHSKPSPPQARVRLFLELRRWYIIGFLVILIGVIVLWWKKDVLIEHLPQMPQTFVSRFMKKSSETDAPEPKETVKQKRIREHALATAAASEAEANAEAADTQNQNTDTSTANQSTCSSDFPPDQIPADVLKKCQQEAKAPIPQPKAVNEAKPKVGLVVQQKAASEPKPKAPVAQEAPPKKQEVVHAPVAQPVAASAPKVKVPALPAGAPKALPKKVAEVTHDVYSCSRRAESGMLMHVNCGRGMPIVHPNGAITCESSRYFLLASEKVCYGVQR